MKRKITPRPHRLKEISYAPLPDDMTSKLRSTKRMTPDEIRQQNKERTRRKRERQKNLKKIQSLRSKLERLEEEYNLAQQELDDMFNDMEKEAGMYQQQGKDWSDKEGNRWGAELQKQQDKIGRLKSQMTDIRQQMDSLQI